MADNPSLQSSTLATFESGTIAGMYQEVTTGAQVPRGVCAYITGGSTGAWTFQAVTSSVGHPTNVIQLGGNTITLGAGAVGTGTQRITLASDDPLVAAVGAKADAVATTDTGTFSLLAFFKRHLERVTTLLGQLPAALTGSGNLKVSLQESNASQAVTNAGTFAVQVSSALPAGTNAIGKLSANSGVDIGDTDVTSVVPGTGVTNLGKAEDAVHSSGDVGVFMLGVRKDSATQLADTDGDYCPFITDSSGRLHVNVGNTLTVTGTVAVTQATAANLNCTEASAAAIKTAVEIMDDWDESDRAKVNPIVGQAGVAAGAGTVGVTTQRTTLASDDPAVTSLAVMDDWDESDRAKVNPIVGQAGVAAGAGAVGTTTQRMTLASDDPAVVSLAVVDDWDRTDRCGTVPAYGAATLTSASINAASSGDNTLISGTGGQTIKVYRILLVLASDVSVKFRDGAGGTDFMAAMTMKSGGSVCLDFEGEPWFSCADGNHFVLNLSGAVQASGRIWYIKS